MAKDDEFAEFVAVRYRALVRTALAMTGDLGHAEDLTQSALLRTYRSWSRLREVANAESYARRTLIRLALRERQRRWHREISAERIPEPMAALTAFGTFSPGLDGQDLAIDVRRALLALPAEQRAVLVLRYLDDQSEAEIASVLGISPGTVKSRASRGLAGLRRAGLLEREGELHEN